MTENSVSERNARRVTTKRELFGARSGARVRAGSGASRVGHSEGERAHEITRGGVKSQSPWPTTNQPLDARDEVGEKNVSKCL